MSLVGEFIQKVRFYLLDFDDVTSLEDSYRLEPKNKLFVNSGVIS